MKKLIPRIGSSLMKVHLMQRMKKHTIKYTQRFMKKTTSKIMSMSGLVLGLRTGLSRMKAPLMQHTIRTGLRTMT